ncbi:MAG: hypothetical protein ACI4MQ_04640 [Candidatus Coproplasma sp.]
MQVELNVAEVYEKHAREHSTASEEVQTVKGWKISARQCELITLGDRNAVNKFFEDNLKRLKICAWAFLRSRRLFTNSNFAFVEVDELINQVYVDMRRGFLVMDMQHISALAYRSFRFAGVGGFGDELGAYTYKPRKRVEAVQ